MNNATHVSTPPYGALIRVSGADCEAFLQGQLSHDMRALTPETACLSSVNSPKGRVIATMVACRLGEDVGLLVAPDMADALCQRLRMFVLRSKVTLSVDDSTPISGVIDTEASTPPASPWQCRWEGDQLWIQAPGRTARWWCIGTPPTANLDDTQPHAFALADIASGLPCIGKSQTEAHVAQHLGLQHFGALSFDKGCFTGQEVIARLHYRGGINRVPVRLRGDQPPPEAGTALQDGDGRTIADVVNSVAVDGGHETLAVWRGTEPPQHVETAEGIVQSLPFDTTP